jgi:hypothetical protein
MTGRDVREIMVSGIERILNRPWLSGITREERAVLLAARSVINSDDTVAERIAQAVGPHYEEAPGDEAQTD